MMTYKYYPAMTPDGREKSGINRICYDENGQEVTREYITNRPDPQQITWANEQEIERSLTKNQEQ